MIIIVPKNLIIRYFHRVINKKIIQNRFIAIIVNKTQIFLVNKVGQNNFHTTKFIMT